MYWMLAAANQTPTTATNCIGKISKEKIEPFPASLGLFGLNLFKKIFSSKCPDCKKAIFLNFGGIIGNESD